MKRFLSVVLAVVVIFTNNQISGISVQAEEVQEEKKNIAECKFVEELGKFDTIGILPSQTYTGNEIIPEITIKDGDYVLEEGIDYTVSPYFRADNVNANPTPWYSFEHDYGENCPQIVVYGKGRYNGLHQMVFAILSENQKETENHLIYSDKAVLEGYDGVTIDGYVGAETHVTIPYYIDGKPVQEINKNAFAYNPALQSVDISDNVFRIMDGAFYHCGNLQEVKLSNQLWGIGNGAFADCISLKDISLPASMEKIGHDVFTGCLSMEAVYSKSDTVYTVDGVLYDKNAGAFKVDTLYFYPPAKEADIFSIPDGTEEIWSNAFRYVGGINNIIIPSSVKLMFSEKYGSFYGMTSPVNIIYKHDVPSTKPMGILAPNTFYDLPAGSTITVKNQEMKEAAEAAISEECKGNVTVQITKKPSDGFELTKKEFVLSKGEETQLHWSQVPEDTTENIIWKSLDESIAKVDPVFGTITAEGYGKCKITGTDESGHTAEADVFVYDPCTSHSLKIVGWTGADKISGWEGEYPTWAHEVTECTVVLGEEDIYLKAEADGYAGAQEVVYKSENENIATVRASERDQKEAFLDIKKTGTVTITATFDSHNETFTDCVTIHVVEPAEEQPNPENPGWIINPGNPTTPQIPSEQPGQKKNQILQYKKSYKKPYGSRTFNLNVQLKGGNGTLHYSSSNPKTAVVDSKGKVSIKGTGRTFITVTAAETKAYKKKMVKITVDITPKKQAASVKASSGSKMTVKWKGDAKADGYQVQYSTDRRFKKGVTTKRINGSKTVSRTFSKLKKGKTYYVRVCSYKNVKENGKAKKLCGPWSSIKKSKNIW